MLLGTSWGTHGKCNWESGGNTLGTPKSPKKSQPTPPSPVPTQWPPLLSQERKKLGFYGVHVDRALEMFILVPIVPSIHKMGCFPRFFFLYFFFLVWWQLAILIGPSLKKELKLWKLPKSEVSVWTHRASSWPRYIGKKGRTFGKPYGIKVWCLGDTPLRNTLGTCGNIIGMQYTKILYLRLPHKEKWWGLSPKKKQKKPKWL